MFGKLLLIIGLALPAVPLSSGPLQAGDEPLPSCREPGIGSLCYSLEMMEFRNQHSDEELMKIIRTWPKKKLYALALANGYLCGWGPWSCHTQGIHEFALYLDRELGRIIGPPPVDPDLKAGGTAGARVRLRQATGRLGEALGGGSGAVGYLFYPDGGLPPMQVIFPTSAADLAPGYARAQAEEGQKMRIYYSYAVTLWNGYPQYHVSRAELTGRP